MLPKSSVIIAVYNGLNTLELVLTGYCRQSLQDFEVVIADDGSRPEMRSFIDAFSRRCPFPVQYLWQPDDGFRKSRILNQAISAAVGEYLIFADADCIPHPKFVEAHIEHGAARTVLCGRRVNLGPSASQKLTPQDIASGRLDRLTSPVFSDTWLRRGGHIEEGLVIRNKTVRGWFHRHAKPKLFGCNFSLEKPLIEEVNGFNEDFVDYWGEDTELEHRLRVTGARFEWIRHVAVQYHLDHPMRSATERSSTLLDRCLADATMASCRNGLRKPVETDKARSE